LTPARAIAYNKVAVEIISISVWLKVTSRGENILKMANQVGKRYYCGKCGSEFIVTRAGEGTLSCCGQPMELKK